MEGFRFERGAGGERGTESGMGVGRRQERSPECQENGWKYAAAVGLGRWWWETLESLRNLGCKRFPGLNGGDLS